MTRRLMQAMAGARHGGAETFFVRLAAALQRAGETQRVLIRRDPERVLWLRSAGVAVGELRFGGPLDFATRSGFRREIAAWCPDVVLTWMSRATAACPRGDFVHIGRLGGYYDLKYYRRCDHLVANTRAIVAYAVKEGWPADRIDYLPNFVPDAAAAAADGTRSPGDAPRALALGRLHPNKGFRLLLEALAQTRNVQLTIAGDGPLRGALERLAQHLGIAPRVRFLGWRDDVPALLAQTDLLVCPSLHEPLGNVVLEAWSAGVPVAATASDGPAGLIENETSGILVPLPDQPGGGPAALAAAIDRLCGDPALRERLGRAGRRAFEAEFTEAAVVARYRDLFGRLASSRAASPDRPRGATEYANTAGQGRGMGGTTRGRRPALRSGDFPAGTPLAHFFAWNERAWRPDRRYVIACDLHRIAATHGRDAAVAHLAGHPITVGRRRRRVLGRVTQAPKAGRRDDAFGAAEVARETVERLAASLGSADPAAHAALFAAFEKLADRIELDALAARRPKLNRQIRPAPRRILVIRLSALGDFVQALGPVTAIRRHHHNDHITLLTTAPLAEFARRLGLFDKVVIDRRPTAFDVSGWLALRRALRQDRFDRVYDLQTSQRSAFYWLLFRPGPLPEWSGIARGCSHPHANLDRDTQHTIDKQAEQLLMAGIYPTPLPALPPLCCDLPSGLAARRFVLLAPGSSPRHPDKRWPARRFGMLAHALQREGCASVVIGSADEAALAAEIREACPTAIDLVGRTDLDSVAALAQQATLIVGNDTGVTHLAAAAGCPVVVLFSRVSDPEWCAPRGRLVRVVSAPVLDRLEVEPVFAASRDIIAHEHPARREWAAPEPAAGTRREGSPG